MFEKGSAMYIGIVTKLEEVRIEFNKQHQREQLGLHKHTQQT